MYIQKGLYICITSKWSIYPPLSFLMLREKIICYTSNNIIDGKVVRFLIRILLKNGHTRIEEVFNISPKMCIYYHSFQV